MQLSEYKFCDYSDNRNKFIACFHYFYDTEKINRLKQFLEVNKNRNVDILCPSFLKDEIKKELPNAIFTTFEIEKYVDTKRNIYG